MIYLFLLVLILIGVYKYDLKPLKYKGVGYKNLEFVVFLLLVLIPGLSYRIGVDTPGYMRDYDMSLPLSKLSLNYLRYYSDEYGWLFFQSICKSLFDEYAFMHTMQCLLLHLSLYYFIAKLSSRHFIVLLLYTITVWGHLCFEALRESLAYTIFLIALCKYIQTNSIKKFLLYSIPCLFFHKFAFVPVISTFIAISYTRNRIYATLLVGMVVVLLIANYNTLLSLMWAGKADDVSNVIDYYHDSNTSGSFKMSLIGTTLYLFSLVVPCLVLICIDKKIALFSKNYVAVLLVMAFIGIVSSFLSDFRRIWYYFLPFLSVCLGDLLERKSILFSKARIVNWQYKILSLSIIYLIFSGVLGFCRPSAIEFRKHIHYNVFYFPYSSVFSEDKDPLREAIAH